MLKTHIIVKYPSRQAEFSPTMVVSTFAENTFIGENVTCPVVCRGAGIGSRHDVVPHVVRPMRVVECLGDGMRPVGHEADVAGGRQLHNSLAGIDGPCAVVLDGRVVESAVFRNFIDVLDSTKPFKTDQVPARFTTKSLFRLKLRIND